MRGRLGAGVHPVSVVVTVRNAAATLPGLLDSLRALRWRPLETVFVDAFSTDGTWELLQAFAAEAPFPVVLDQTAGGIGAGRNQGFRLATSDFVAVTDADMRVPPDWLEHLMAGMAEGVGVVGGPNEADGGGLLQRATGAIPVHGPSTGEVPVFGRSRFHAGFVTRSDVFAAVTRNCLFRREAFERAGGFDETLVTTEDGELNRRILDAGFQISYRPDAKVTHVHRDSVRGFFRQMRNYARGQAQANRKQPAMRRLRHPLPSLAAGAGVALAVATVVWPPLWPVLAAFAAAAGVAVLAYGVKVAIVRRDAALLLPAAGLFLVWQSAWALGYVEGMAGAARGGSHAGR